MTTFYVELTKECKHGGFNCAELGQKNEDWHLTGRPPKDCLGLAILDLRHRLSDHQGGRQAH